MFRENVAKRMCKMLANRNPSHGIPPGFEYTLKLCAYFVNVVSKLLYPNCTHLHKNKYIYLYIAQ